MAIEAETFRINRREKSYQAITNLLIDPKLKHIYNIHHAACCKNLLFWNTSSGIQNIVRGGDPKLKNDIIDTEQQVNIAIGDLRFFKRRADTKGSDMYNSLECACEYLDACFEQIETEIKPYALVLERRIAKSREHIRIDMEVEK